MAAARRLSQTRRANRLTAVTLLAGAGAVAWRFLPVFGEAFVGGRPAPGSRGAPAALARRAFAFEVVEKDEHVGLRTSTEDDGAIRISTKGPLERGATNTVLGDQEIPNKGRTYWEVKYVGKEMDNFEYVGVAEAAVEPTRPLTKNTKGKAFFLGADLGASWVYHFMPVTKEMTEFEQRKQKEFTDELKIEGKYPINMKDKDMDAQMKERHGKWWTGPGVHVGYPLTPRVPIRQGTTIGIDVDMDKGTLAFWKDGKYQGPMYNTYGKPVDLKGKKLFPAVSVWGKTVGYGGDESHTGSTVEIRTGLEPPPLP